MQNNIINNILRLKEVGSIVLLLYKVKLGVFTGSNYKLKESIWENFNWEVDKCVLRSDNNPIKNNI